jgi:hypothetical protein
MYRIFFVLILAILLNACASPQQKAQIAEFYKWQSSTQDQAKNGKVQWSVYYTELWTRLNQMPDDPQKPLAMSTTAELIPIARNYEAGKITKEQFEDLRRIIVSRTNQERQITLQQQKAINDAQAQRLYQLGNQLLQPPRNPTTNCISTRIGPDQVRTNCN